MENKQQKKKKKKPPLKVVYISNPMKLKTSASNFRSVVQELTGQHSVWPVDPSKYSSLTADADLSTASTSLDNINGTAEPSPDVSSHLCYQKPSDQLEANYADDRVVLIHHHMLHYMLHDHQDFAPQSDSRNNF